jgi:hypothetical protein
MVIIFVEDRALKLFVQKLCGRLGIICSPCMPAAEGGGWSEVLRKVKGISRKDHRIIGIIEGDLRKHAEQDASWKDISDRVFVARKTELEEYLFQKRKSLVALADLPPGTQYSEFKHFINKDAPEAVVHRTLKELSKQECEEINSLVDFIKSC